MKKENIKMPDGKDYQLKKDKYSKTRGGTSEVLEIICAPCSSEVLVYQKDGPGNLLRCYLDRIMWPPDKSSLQKKNSVKEIPNLDCKNCDSIIGTPMIYEKENRLAYRLRRGTYKKRVYKPKN